MIYRLALIGISGLSFCSGLIGEFSLPDFDYIVTIPDIHGDLEFLIYSLLLAAKNTNYPSMTVADLEGHLVNGTPAVSPTGEPKRTVLIQLGDVINRGPGSKQCITVLAAVERIFGWTKVQLYGNHELMAFTGKDSRYVDAAEYEFFNSREERSAEFSASGSLWQSIHSTSLLMSRFSLRSTERSVGDILFVHAGLDSGWLSSIGDSISNSVPAMNKLTHALMLDPVKADQVFSIRSSPLWTRGFETLSHNPDWCLNEFQEILDKLNVSKIVMGHCPLDSKRVEARCGGSLIMTDVRLSRWMGGGGQPVAVVFSPLVGSIEAHYIDPVTLTTEFKHSVVSSSFETTNDEPLTETLIELFASDEGKVSDIPARSRSSSAAHTIFRAFGCVSPPKLRRASSCPIPNR